MNRFLARRGLIFGLLATLAGLISWKMLQGYTWNFDGRFLPEATRRWVAGGSIYADPGYLYSPAGLLLGLPLALVPNWVGYAILMSAKIIIAAGFAFWRGRAWGVVGLFTFVMFWFDVFGGNVTLFIVAAMGLVIWKPRWWAGIPLGVVAAAFAKPLLAGFLLWALVYRRSAFLAASATGGVMFAAAGLVVPASAWLDWVHNLVGVSHGIVFAGNEGLARYGGVPAAAIGALATLGGLVLAIKAHDEDRALVWAICGTILAVPYTGWVLCTYIVLTVEPIVRRRPQLGAWLPAATPLAIISLPFVALMALVVMRSAPRSAEPGVGRGPTSSSAGSNRSRPHPAGSHCSNQRHNRLSRSSCRG